MRTQPLIALLAMCLTPASAQVGRAPEERVEIEQIREQRQRVEKNDAIEASRRTRILERYDEAIRTLESEGAAKRTEDRLKLERDQIDSTVEALQADLNQPQPALALNLPDNPTADQVEVELARARAHLEGSRTALRAEEQERVERDKRRNEISKRLGGLDQQIEALSDRLTARHLDEAPEMQDAVNASLRAQKQYAAQDIQTLRAELALLDKRSALIPLRVDLAQRRVSYDEHVVVRLEAEAAAVRAEEAVASLDDVTELSRQAREGVPALEGIAKETEELARMLWARDGVLNQSATVDRRLADARKSLTDLDRMDGLIRRQFAASGRRSISHWWPKVPDDFPKTGEVDIEFDTLQQRIPEVQQELIRLEELRTDSSDLRLRTLQKLRAGPGETSHEAERMAETLLSTRQNLLDQLVQAYGRYSNQMIELGATLDGFLEKLRASQGFLFERVFWIRSAPVGLGMSNVAGALVWYFSAESWSGLFRSIGRGLAALPWRGVGTVLVLALLVWSRRRVLRRLDRLAELVRDPVSSDSLRPTLEAAALTVVLAAPAPTALYVLKLVLLGGNPSPFLFAAATAVGYLALVVGVVELWRQMLCPNGLGEAHFRWIAQSTRSTYRGLLRSELLLLLPLYIALHCSFVGMALSSPPEMQAFNNSLGRIAFCIAMTIFGLSLFKVFRPGVEILDRRFFPRWPGPHIYTYIFIIGILLPAVLAVAGYYLTGYLLAFQALRMLGLLAGLALLSGVLARWRLIQLRQVAARLAPASKADLKEIDIQVGKLFRLAVTVAAAIGLYGIWSQALPALQILKRIQILPQFAIIETAETRAQQPAAPAREASAATGASKPTPQTGGTSPAAAVVPGGSPPNPADQRSDPSGLTLWSVLQALLAAVITWVLVANIPGVLALTLRRRTKFDSGARVAFTTLVRYVILILGVSATFGLLGVTWSKIQFLAAALTFGLGFGLQEVVANFVSGLILLMERPLRVGDAVTVGNLQGRVTRIQIRSTTIALWDGSEMIVPNKEFITSKLINWTLSDSKRRIDIPLRVAYGADIQKVKELLLEVTQRNPIVLKDPEPVAVLDQFADDALKFELRFFVEFDTTVQAKQEVYEAIDQVFRQEGIRFALPRLDVQVADGQQPEKQTATPGSDAVESTSRAAGSAHRAFTS
jgi:potassium efflux system protein